MRLRPKAVWAAALFAGGFAAARCCIGLAVPEEIDGLTGAKLCAFTAEKDSYTALFIGDSRTYREMVPQRYDAVLEGAGVAGRSFNMGLPGMSLFEADYLLRRIAALRPARLRYVFVGAHTNPDEPQPDLNPRTLYWRTIEESLVELRCLLWGRDRYQGPEAVAVAANALRLAAFRLLARGWIAAALSSSSETRSESARTQVESLRGYLPLESDTDPEFAPYREIFRRAGPAGFASRLEAWRNSRQSRSPELDAAQAAGFARLRRTASDTGWSLFFVGEIMERHPQTGCETPSEDCAVFDFWDLGRYGDFYRYDQFYDAHHLTREAAGRFTKALARRFLEWRGGHSSPIREPASEAGSGTRSRPS